MKYVSAWLLAMLCLAPAAARSQPLQEARQRLLHGNYAEARGLYAPLTKAGPERFAAAVGMSRAWRAEGEYDKALAALDDALKADPRQADLLAERADLLYLRGRWDEAPRSAAKALEANKEQYLAHWVLARVHRDRGELDKAGEDLVWFIRAYGNNEITDPDNLLLVGLAACERARWHGEPLSDQFQFVLTEIYSDLAKKHKGYWPAEYQAGMLYLEKYNKPGAIKAFDRALKINERAAEVLAARGALALQRFELDKAREAAAAALKVNPRLVEALVVEADVALAAGDTAAALKHLERARAVNPRAEPTLARVAACLYLDHKDAELAALVKQVEKQDPKAGVFYSELAERLDERKRWDDAEKYYRRALKLRPELTGPRAGLGMLYMRLGREEEARPILEKVFKDDPFSVRVLNTLKVLDHLDQYATLKTPHFQVRYDGKHDAVLARFLGKYLEDIYTELGGKFQFHPSGPYLIEVFTKHEMFSGRVVALPDLHTIGACSGRMVALVSPHDTSGVIPKPFNWNRVLRHELTHVFNLEQTRFQVPHWLTEGLAVTSEQMPMPPLWNRILLERVPRGELMNLDNIHLGFIRPANGEEWHLAYAQSFLYVDYLKKAHGAKTVGELLNAYRDGLDTAAALRKVCHVSKEAFEKGYRAHLQEVIKNIAGRPPVKRLSFEELKAAHARSPEDAGVTAQLAERYLLLGNRGEARKLADAALEQKKAQPLASYVKARLLIAGGDTEAAVQLLEAAVDRKDPEAKVLRLLGKLQFDAKKFSEAAQTFELGRSAEPYEPVWLTQLARAYTQTGDKEKLIETLKRLAPTDADDLGTRRQLAQLLLKGNRPAEAELYAREALEIDVLDEGAQEALESALRAQNKDDELKELHRLLGRS
jgi:tetratricopeptide (TPR) repeat protein